MNVSLYKKGISKIAKLFLVKLSLWFSFLGISCPVVTARQQDSSIVTVASDIQRAIEIERKRLDSRHTEERRDALLNLAHMARPESSRVASLALKDRVAIVRATAVHAVLYLPAVEFGPLLIPLLKDRDEFVRRETAYALGKTAHRVAVPALITTLERDKKASVRAAAAIALGQIGDKEATQALIQTLTSRVTSKNLLGTIPKGRRMEDDDFVRRSAVISLGQIKSREAVPVLGEILSNKRSNDDLRREAARSLGIIGDPMAIPMLRSVLHTHDPYLTTIANEALLRLTSIKESSRG
jgi:HEAT repeat protein